MKVTGPDAASLQHAPVFSRSRIEEKIQRTRGCWSRARIHVYFGLYVLFLVGTLAIASRFSIYIAEGVDNLDVKNDNLARAAQDLQQAGLSTCGVQTSDNAQRFFQVNLPVYFASQLTSATYTDAKLISLAWNLVIGQGGRILHGWILCFHVIPDALTRLLEGSAGLPYTTLVKLYFSGTSLEALWASWAVLFRNRKSFPTIGALSVALVYTLLYPTVWDAATGYYQPSQPIYRMPSAFGPAYSEGTDLEPCWMINDTRISNYSLTITDGSPEFEASSFTYTLEQEGDIDFFFDYSLDGHRIAGGGFYTNISAYAQLQTRLRVALLYACNELPIGVFDNYNGLPYQYASFDRTNLTVNNTTLHGTIYTGDPNIDVGSTKYSLNNDVVPSCDLPSSISLGTVCNWDYCNENELTQAQSAALDPTASRANGAIPFNSTIWWNGTETNLAAPMLNLTNGCHAYGTHCLCYNKYPLTYNFTDPEYVQCVTTSGYAWGFAVSVTIFAVSLELIWVIICYVLWLDAQINSQLVKHRRRGGGEIRNILDFAARINAELGPDTLELSNEELRALLKEKDDIKHEMMRDDQGEWEIGVFAGTKKHYPRRRRQARGNGSVAQGAQGMATETTIVPESPSESKLQAFGSPSGTSQVSVSLESPSQSSLGSGTLFASETKHE